MNYSHLYQITIMFILPTFFLTLIPTECTAQPAEEQIRSVKIELGKFADGRPIPGLVFHSQSLITAYSIDTARQEFLLEFTRQIGDPDALTRTIKRIALFDLKTNTFKWGRDFKSYSDFSFHFTNDHIVQYFQGKFATYNKLNGNKLWQASGEIEYVDDWRNIAITTSGQAYDLRSGKIIWSGNIRSKWHDFQLLNDSMLLVAAGGLLAVNLNDGRGWSFEPEANDAKSSELKACSNILLEDGKIFFASSDCIYCLNVRGEQQWAKPFPKKTGSRSNIEIHDRYVYVINEGLDNSGTWYGKPFIAGYNKETGESKYFELLDLRERFMDVYASPAATVIHSKGIIYKYNLYNGEKILEKKTTGTPLENAVLIPHGRCLVNDDDKFLLADVKYADNYLLANNTDTVICTDIAFNPVDKIPPGKWWHLYNRMKSVFFIKQDKNTVLIKDAKKLATIKMDKVIVVGDKIIDINPDNFKIINTTGLF